MNILIFYTNNPMKGAGGLALDIFNEFRKNGHTVRMLINDYDEDFKTELPEGITNLKTFATYKKEEITRKILRKLGLRKEQKTNPDYHFEGTDLRKPFYKTKTLLKKAGIKPDAIIIFFCENFINAKNMYELNKYTGAPVYWGFYDMAPMTGGCHYAWDCTGYQHQCGKCPGIYSDDPADITNKNFLFKKKYLDNTDLRVVVGTEWQHHQVKKSGLFQSKPLRKILTAMNPEIFKPVSRKEAREKIGIPFGKKVIFFGAVYLDHKRKGFDYLLEALNNLKSMLQNDIALADKILLLIAGMEFESINDKMPFDYHYMGMVDNSTGIASAYQAADIYVCPSIEDSGPSMINQSIMTGTPVVSFETGVSLDLVHNGKTGYRARLRDSNDLAAGILEILRLPEHEYQQMKNNCRGMALELFHPDVNLRQWVDMITKN